MIAVDTNGRSAPPIVVLSGDDDDDDDNDDACGDYDYDILKAL